MKATLTHIGAISLGKLLAIWSFVLGAILYVFYLLLTLMMSLFGLVAGDQNALAGGIIAFLMTAIFGFIGLIFYSIGMFIFGFLAAVVYNIILGVDGGIDIDLKERTN
ncbi:MAG TPA: hypothetical protein PKJ97_00710 [Candidatus Bilamarchaeaceae archaeon]|nr:hypothetical protein [Candidatus Bilamarchaeaceae archaeon]